MATSQRMFARSVAALAIVLIGLPKSATSQTRETTSTTRTPSTTSTTTTRSTLPPPTYPAPAPAPAPATSNLAAPLWMTLTKIICDVPARGLGEDDISYAIVTAVRIDLAKPWLSQALVRATNLYDRMGSNDFRVPNLSVWGINNTATPIPDRGDVVMFAHVYNNTVNPAVLRSLIEANVIQQINSFHPGDTYSQIVQRLFEAVRRGESSRGLGPLQQITLTDSELSVARSGAVAKRELVFLNTSGYGIPGKYRLRLQLGRSGVSEVAW